MKITVDLSLTVVQMLFFISHYLSIQLTLNSLLLHLVHALLETSALVSLLRAKVLGKYFSMLTLLKLFSKVFHIHLLFQNSF